MIGIPIMTQEELETHIREKLFELLTKTPVRMGPDYDPMAGFTGPVRTELIEYITKLIE